MKPKPITPLDAKLEIQFPAINIGSSGMGDSTKNDRRALLHTKTRGAMTGDIPVEVRLDPMVEPVVEVVECKTWRNFAQILHAGKSHPIEPLYRGQCDASWALVPPSRRGRYEVFKSGHLPDGDFWAGNYEGQWKFFRYLATGMPGTDITKLNDIEVKALGRHHGLISDLLDWSSSPYVAAFFAFADVATRCRTDLHGNVRLNPDGHIAVWRLSWTKSLARPGELELLTAQSSVNYWQKAQAGCFTRLIKRPYLDLARYLESIGMNESLRKITIPASEVWIALRDLEEMNITYDRLMPDFRGAVLRANLGDAIRMRGLLSDVNQ